MSRNFEFNPEMYKIVAKKCKEVSQRKKFND